MSGRLQGRTALITGATSNIGRAIAVAFAAEGAHVIVSGRDAQRAAAVLDEIAAAGGRAQFVAADLDGSADASRRLAVQATDALGGAIDVLVNNAGIFPGATTAATDERSFDEVYAVNVKAPFFLTAVVAPQMAARGDGAIINLGSWVARLGIPVGALYASTKGAMETLTRAWAAEFGPVGVRGPDGALRGVSLGYDCDVVDGIDQRSEAVPDYGMVIDDQESDHDELPWMAGHMGSCAQTRPPVEVGPASRVPPAPAARSRMLAMPKPSVHPPGSAVPLSSISMCSDRSIYTRRTAAVASECRAMLVNASAVI